MTRAYLHGGPGDRMTVTVPGALPFRLLVPAGPPQPISEPPQPSIRVRAALYERLYFSAESSARDHFDRFAATGESRGRRLVLQFDRWEDEPDTPTD